MAKGIDIPIQNRNAGNIVSENPIISSFISACISQCGTFFKPGMSFTKSMKNMVRARNTSTAATRCNVELFIQYWVFADFYFLNGSPFLSVLTTQRKAFTNKRFCVASMNSSSP